MFDDLGVDICTFILLFIYSFSNSILLVWLRRKLTRIIRIACFVYMFETNKLTEWLGDVSCMS